MQATWVNRAGMLCAASAKLRDISGTGVSLEVPERIEPFALLKLKSAQMAIDGTAVVRYCRFTGARPVIGLEMLARETT